jgi:hypothetical protein
MGETLPPSTSAQLAELIALTKALQLSERKTANIYIDLSSMPMWLFGKSEDC